jgi:hypothetical protein
LEELNQRIPVNENGRRKSITKREAAAKQLVNKAVTGDYRFLKMLAELVKLSEQANASETENHSKGVESVRERVIERLDLLRKRLGETDQLKGP